MSESLSPDEHQEAWDALEELEGGNFRFAAFTKQLKRKGFRLAGVGQFFTFEGRYGSLQIEQALLGGDPKIIACSYIPSGDPGRAYALVTEGISTTGRSLSGEDLERLRAHRRSQVEDGVMEIIYQQGVESPQPEMRLREDLGFDEVDLIDITFALEEKFGITIRDKQAERFETVADVLSFVREAKTISAA